MKSFIYLVLFITISHSSVARNSEQSSNWQTDLNSVYELEELKPVGSTMFSIFIWDLYKSKLLTTSGTYPLSSDNEQLVYEIEYLKDISSEDLVGRTIEQWQHLGVSEASYRRYLSQLKQIWPDIKSGDTLTLVTKNNGSAFYYNKQMVGEINEAEFGPLFIDIWLSEKTSQPKLRSELLGVKNNG